jgi:arginine/lysine/ornithine decarboxylase
MTMGSYIHFNSDIVDLKKLTYYLQVFQSSSPSYPLMASLDVARYYLATLSEADLKETLDKIYLFKLYIKNNIPQLKVINNDEYQLDPLKLLVQTACNLTGFELQKIFEEEAIYTEMADQNNVLFVLPLTVNIDLLSVGEKIKRKLKDMVVKQNAIATGNYYSQNITSLALSYEEMEYMDVELVSLEKAIGKVISEEIIPYPPGIPLLLSGERVEREHIEQLYMLKNAGAYFQGFNVFQKGVKVFKNT